MNIYNYKIHSFLGCGSYGYVYTVIKDGKEYAMKIVSCYFLNKETREIKLIKDINSLNHPNIAKFYDIFQLSRKDLGLYLGKDYFKDVDEFFKENEKEDDIPYYNNFSIFIVEKMEYTLEDNKNITSSHIIQLYKTVYDLLEKGYRPYDIRRANIGIIRDQIKIFDFGLFTKEKTTKINHLTILKYLKYTKLDKLINKYTKKIIKLIKDDTINIDKVMCFAN